MAHIPMDDIEEVWSKMGEDRSWNRLESVLTDMKDSSSDDNVEDELVDQMLSRTRDKQGEGFPRSPEQLQKELGGQSGESVY